MEGETDLVLGLAASALSGLSSAYAGEFASRLSAQRCLAYLHPPPAPVSQEACCGTRLSVWVLGCPVALQCEQK